MKARQWFFKGLLGLLVLCLVLAGSSALINRNLPAESTEVQALSDAEKARLAEFFQEWKSA